MGKEAETPGIELHCWEYHERAVAKVELDLLFCMWFLTLIFPFPAPKNSDVSTYKVVFSVSYLEDFQSWSNKMGLGKFWVWHVATCTLCTSWNVCGILGTYEQLWCVVQTRCTWMRTGQGMARRQEHRSCSRLPAAMGGEWAPSSEPPPNPAHIMAEPRTGQNNSGASPGSPLTALGDDQLSTQQLKSQQCPGRHEQECWE